MNRYWFASIKLAALLSVVAVIMAAVPAVPEFTWFIPIGLALINYGRHQALHHGRDSIPIRIIRVCGPIILSLGILISLHYFF